MSGAVFTDADRVVSENIGIGKLRQRGQPNGSAAIIGKNHERRARCAKEPVIRDAVENCAHSMFANAESDVASAGIIAIKITSAIDVVHCRSV